MVFSTEGITALQLLTLDVRALIAKKEVHEKLDPATKEMEKFLFPWGHGQFPRPLDLTWNKVFSLLRSAHAQIPQEDLTTERNRMLVNLWWKEVLLWEMSCLRRDAEFVHGVTGIVRKAQGNHDDSQSQSPDPLDISGMNPVFAYIDWLDRRTQFVAEEAQILVPDETNIIHRHIRLEVKDFVSFAAEFGPYFN